MKRHRYTNQNYLFRTSIYKHVDMIMLTSYCDHLPVTKRDPLDNTIVSRSWSQCGFIVWRL